MILCLRGIKGSRVLGLGARDNQQYRSLPFPIMASWESSPSPTLAVLLVLFWCHLFDVYGFSFKPTSTWVCRKVVVKHSINPKWIIIYITPNWVPNLHEKLTKSITTGRSNYNWFEHCSESEKFYLVIICPNSHEKVTKGENTGIVHLGVGSKICWQSLCWPLGSHIGDMKRILILTRHGK